MASVTVNPPGEPQVPNDESLLAGKVGLAGELAAAGVSAPGIQFILQATDPWHTEDTPRVGAPLFDAGKSVVMTVNKTLVITAPPGISGDETYDAHVAVMPILGNSDFGATSEDITFYADRTFGLPTATNFFGGNFIEYSSQPDPPIGNPVLGTVDGWAMDGLIAVHTVPTNMATYTPGFSVQGAAASAFKQPDVGNAAFQTLTVPQLTEYQQSRLVGLSYKVTNTTPPLDQGGYVIDYRTDRLPELSSARKLDGGATSSAGVTFNTNVPSYVCNGPPFSQEKVLLLNHNSRPASCGSLVTVPLDMETTGPTATFPAAIPSVYICQMGQDPNDFVTYSGDTVVGTVDAYTSEAFFLDDQANAYSGSFSRMLGIRPCGSYFTGLPANTTLQLEMRCLVEIFPTTGNPLLNVANMSPPPDPVALEIYQKISRGLPAGAPGGSADNDFGDWLGNVFESARDAVEDVVMPVAATLSALPGPVGEAARATSSVLNPVMGLTDQLIPRRRKKKKAKQRARQQQNNANRGARTNRDRARLTADKKKEETARRRLDNQNRSNRRRRRR